MATSASVFRLFSSKTPLGLPGVLSSSRERMFLSSSFCSAVLREGRLGAVPFKAPAGLAAAATNSRFFSPLTGTQSSAFAAEKRAFSSEADSSVEAASKDLLKTIQSEIQHEQSTYEQDADLKKFLQTSGWSVAESDNNMMVTLQRQVGSKKVVVEFSCVQSAEAPTEEGPMPEMSDFTVTITNPDESGVTFYCSTTQDEEDKFRYCIGQVRFFKNAEEKESLNVYPGPYFEDLDDSFQQGLDEWLAKMGVDPELCDFIDRFSVDKENREYLAWLKKLAQFVEH
ncbi:mitochondrial glycoprotein [Toxoplasma gondii TgCatPRC2]|uniref:Glycoprotein n=15 Tax=Toxoplasma gondii TaxID=5811 RepID=B9PZL6_TOXGV|nr:glycoprotein [Toxoplasma gondii ME49]EPR60205.1 glycoprotein [Toxoplasma gondii GT1]ESS31107.1 glycoprotein [Toxoplasma gondii VEG]KAF4640057.1 glycoprotein [Toxoplasma gondii]KFG36020.1 mitochondrial glycoprotein [Toxoplasma gondii GAB2-2007-GAL-DOM2]KFG39211.1 mitochondrial glycoprotein [Toxoplasma gondii FOU]KFG41602.1 mitochondrial glycoprotein [Toxoplasma gondii p89]KFG62239.1 mitochondrial glycoprotein [Toxoplasma gondii RUB]KFH07876.1 mitochondrial glycoprotein [Toxoplasma gondii |eukprot:XP_002370800.1 glycoprotein [Toxoplasma gondii ME49]